MTTVTADVVASQLLGSKIEQIAKEVLGKETLTDEELETIFSMAVAVTPVEMSISCAETRQVRQYESNNYHASMKMSLGDTDSVVLDRMRKASPENRAAVFTECRRMLYALVALTYKRNENYLRALIVEQQIEDGITQK